LSTALAETFPEIANATQFRALYKMIAYQEKEIPHARYIFADSAFFDVFTFPVIRGNLSAAFANPNTAIVTKSFAAKLFGSEDPLGKSLQLGFRSIPTSEVTVVALIEDVPKNSHFSFDLVLPYSVLLKSQDRAGAINWSLSYMKTYLRFDRKIDRESFEEKLAHFVEQTGGNLNQQQHKLLLQPLTAIHLSSALPYDDASHTDIRDIYVFAGIALLVLVIACLNYIVLVTARYGQRLKEVGVRKIVGASSNKLILQFLIEAVLLALLAMPLAFGIVELAYQEFGEILGKELQVDFTANSFMIWGNVILLAFFTLAAGLYPAFFFAKIGSVATLQGRHTGVPVTARLRKILTITQFGIAIALLVCVGVMQTQLRYTRSKDLGYRHNNILVMPTAALGQQAGILKQAALSYSAVHAATLTGWLPGYLSGSSSMANPNGEGVIETEFVSADCDLVATLQMELVDGRGFDCSNPSDTFTGRVDGKLDWNLLPRVPIILNETAVRALNLSSPVGQALNYPALQGTVIGVVKDIHNRSLHNPVKPMVIRYSNYAGHLVVAYRPGAETEVLQYLRQEWQKLPTKSAFNYFFLDDHLRQLYASDEKFLKMAGGFTVLAVVLSCLGLFGLAAFTAERRTKEIGIRKVLGATVANVTALLSKDFVKLVLLANLIAWPVAWIAMNQWLQNFAYRIEISWWVFALAGGLALVIALLTVSTQA
ncbi:MAG: ABC transporter permease, partial [bacterium]